MAVKLAKAMGAEVIVFTQTKDKLDEAAKLGAQGVYSKDADQMKAKANSCDFILSTIPEATDLEPFIPALKRDGSLVIVGALDKLKPFNNMEVAMHRKSVAGSLIGSIRETQEVLDFCADHGITPDVELIKMEDINDAHKRIDDREVRFRYVIDMASLKPEQR